MRHNWYRGRVLVLAAVALGLLLPSFPTSVEAFKLSGHGGHPEITRRSLERVRASVGVNLLTFSERAIEDVISQNEDVDDNSFGGTIPLTASWHFDDEQLSAGTRRIVDKRREIIAELSQSTPDGEDAREALGEALHGIQDFYAHSNWVELKERGLAPTVDFGRTVLSDPPATLQMCSRLNPGELVEGGLTNLTTGYFHIIPDRYVFVIEKGKCAHGLGPIPGIAKDVGEGVVPRDYTPAQRAAVDEAEAASYRFVQGIVDELSSAGNLEGIRALMEIRGKLVFVIDVSNSMSDEISQVKAEVREKVEDAVDSDRQPEDYVLVTFSDPVGTQSILVTANPQTFLEAVDALTVDGGGDCPEYAMTAISDAIYAGGRNADIFVFTDASAKDGALQNNIDREAQDQDATISYLITGSCSPIDPAYTATAAASGGQVYSLAPGELSNAFDLINAQTLPDAVSIAHASGTLGATPFTLSAPVDSSVQQVVFAISAAQKQSLVIQSPDGGSVTPTTPGARYTTLSTGWLVTIQKPAVGAWSLTLSGSGLFSAHIQASSAIDLTSVAFVEQQARRHEGLYPIAGQPLAGETHTAEARLLGDVASTEFVLLSERGEMLGPLALTPEAGDALRARTYLGDLRIPGQPFRIAVRGVNSTGQPYQRSFPRLFQGRSVAVSATAQAGEGDFLPGATTPVSITIQNLGDADTFRLEVKDNLGVAYPVEPDRVSLAVGASAVIPVDVGIPALLGSTTEYRLTAVATSITSAERTNSVLLTTIAPGTNIVHLPLVQSLRASSASYSYFDNFTNRATGWFEDERSTISWRYRANEYEMVMRNAETWAGVVGPPNPLSSFSVAADMRLRAGEEGVYGLIFGFLSWNDFFVLAVNPVRQEYSVWHKTSGFDVVIPWTPLATINGGSATNRLAVEWVDGPIVVVRLLINGSQQNAFRITRRTKNVGFFAETKATGALPATFRFDNIQVTQLGPTTTAVAQNTLLNYETPVATGQSPKLWEESASGQ